MVVFSRFFAAATSLAAMFAAVAADLTILTPGGPDLWWVAKSQNVLAWTCHSSPYGNYTVLIAGPNLPAPLAIIGIEENYQCSQEITQDMSNQPPATGYTVLLANPLNSSDVYATSQPFEIKPLGSTYPPASATPTESGYNSASASASGATQSTTTKSHSSASNFKASAGYGIAAVAALLGLVTA
jgi:hypothetical protein